MEEETTIQMADSQGWGLVKAIPRKRARSTEEWGEDDTEEIIPRGLLEDGDAEVDEAEIVEVATGDQTGASTSDGDQTGASTSDEGSLSRRVEVLEKKLKYALARIDELDRGTTAERSKVVTIFNFYRKSSTETPSELVGRCKSLFSRVGMADVADAVKGAERVMIRAPACIHRSLQRSSSRARKWR